MKQECYAVKGKTVIDTIDSETGLTTIYGKTLEDCRQEKGYEHAERMTIDEYCESKAKAQDTPITWTETTEENYYDMLEVLPPACYREHGFMVGEPWDHHALTGRPRYQAFAIYGGRYYVANRPMMTVEFLDMTEAEFLKARTLPA